MAILDTVKKFGLRVKTATGYITYKLGSEFVQMDNGKDLQTTISDIQNILKNQFELKISDESVLINSGARQDLVVKFEKSYTYIPVVIATPYTSTGGGVDIAVKDITNTGFTANMKNGGASAAYFKVCYFVIDTNLASSST